MQANKILVVDDFITDQTQNFICQQLQAEAVPWCFLPDVTHSDKEKRNVGFAHTPFKDGSVQSTAYWFLYPILLAACDKNNIIVKQLLRIRIGLYVNKSSSTTHQRHVDNPMPHLVGLYYVDDSDGDTVFYKDGVSDEELMRCTPKKGRMVLFDGAIYHASTSPVEKTHRMTVNFNFLSE